MRQARLLRSLAGPCFVASVWMSAPAAAGMTQDLSDCTAADRKTSAEACTRVMNSGRLPDEQAYIGYYNRGWSYFNAGAYDNALRDFDQSIKRKPDYADTYMSRAQVQHERGDRAASLADLDRYAELKGNVTEAHLNRARLFRRRGELATAFSELQRAASLDPGDVSVMVMRALVLSDLGEAAPARLEIEKAITAKPDDAAALYARAVVSFRDQQLTAANQDLSKAITLKKAFPAAYALRGEINEKSGDTSAAIASFRKALEFSPRSLDGRAAHETARARLAVLDMEKPVATAPATSDTPDASVKAVSHVVENNGPQCRRFIPSTGTTIAVECR